MATKKVKTKTIKITGCAGCPHVKTSAGPCGSKNFDCWHPTQIEWISWPNTNYPDELRGRRVAEACEHKSEYPTNSFPKWCPL